MGDFDTYLMNVSLELFPPLNDILGTQLVENNIFNHNDQNKTRKQYEFISMQSDFVIKDKRIRKRKHGPDTMCSNCLTQETPEWRHHPLTKEILCNACGLRIRKKIRQQKNEFTKESNECFSISCEYA